MKQRMRRRSWGVVLAIALGLAALQGCGDGASAPRPVTSPGRAPVVGSFALAAATATVPILQGGVSESRLVLTRDGGFSDRVALAVVEVPAGITATIEPNATTGTTAMLVVRAEPAAPVGSIALTISAAAAGRPTQTATVRFGVAPSPENAGNVTVDFSACPAGRLPLWFAFQDGDREWTQSLGAKGVYRFQVAAGKGGYAYATMETGRMLHVAYATQEELTHSPIAVCRAPGPKTVSGRFAGLGVGQVAYVSLGEPNPDPERGPLRAQGFTLAGIDDGPHDLVAYRSMPPRFSETERAIIRRDQNVTHGGSLGVVDFDGPESFAPAQARVTVTGADGIPLAHWMSYLTGPACDLHDLYSYEPGEADFTMRGIPEARQRATDMHRLDVYTTADGRFRAASEIFHTLADRVVAFPSALPEPAITTPAGGHRRIQASLTLPTEYRNGPMLLLMYAYGEHGAFAFTTATPGWFGGPAVTLAVPDFSGVAGWRSAFLPPPDASVGWILQATGSTGVAADGGICTENARLVIAYLGGRS